MSIQDVDFVDVDNSDPPQLWAWSGEVGDETSEALFRLPSAGILQRYVQLEADFDQLQTLADERLQEIERLRAELAEWKHRAIGGTCRIVSDAKCDCSLCQRDAEIERLRDGINELERVMSRSVVESQDGEWVVFENGECSDDRFAPTLLQLVEKLAEKAGGGE